MAIEVYGGAELSVVRALRVIPREIRPIYREAYEWIMADAGTIGPRPYGKTQPSNLSIPLVAQRGIHKPSGLPYALTVTSSGTETYAQDTLNELEDGTWILQYCAHRQNAGKNAGSSIYNRSLRRCLERGLPVGVFIKDGSVYKHMGLAFVEQYDSATDLFLLHGPVTAGTGDSLSPVPAHIRKKIAAETRSHKHPRKRIEEALGYLDDMTLPDADERERMLAEIVRRRQQSTFRRRLLEAYEGRCAASGCDVEPALQAAHITSYLGSKNQDASNGILLRADIHILLDRNLLGIRPDDLSIQLDPQLEHGFYAGLSGKRLCLPASMALQPSRRRVEAQYRNFLNAKRARYSEETARL